MLTISDELTWTHTVTISVPVDGGFDEQTCEVTYRLIEEDLNSFGSVDAMLDAIVVRISDIADKNGNPLSWTDELKAALFSRPYMQVGLVSGYTSSAAGKQAGNFLASAGLGRLAG